MDPLTHVMSGVLVAHLGSGLAPEPACTLTAIGMSIAPDFDFLSRKLPGAAFLRVHHGFTHSILGLAIQTIVYCAIAYAVFLAQPFGFESASFWGLLGIGLAAAVSHVLLDWVMHNNGLPFLQPFRFRRFAFPLILGVNPNTVSHRCHERHFHTCFGCQFRASLRNPVAYFTAIGALLGFIFITHRWIISALTVLITIGYLTFCYWNRELARKALIQFDPTMQSADAYPGRARPDRWLFVRSDDDCSTTAYLVSSTTRSVLHKWVFPPSSVPVDLLRKIPRIMSDLSNCIHHLYPEFSQTNGHTTLNFRDLSFLYSEPMEIGSVRVTLASDGSVISEIYQEVWN